MTYEAPQTRIDELELQLRLSDEGVSRLAERCLELEQQLQTCQAELAKLNGDNEPSCMILPQLFYDSGHGFSPRECLTVTEDSYDEVTHEMSATFILPTDARALRLDPGEVACCLTGLALSDERLSYTPLNGIALDDDHLLFLDCDPNLKLETSTTFPAGMKFAVTYHYYPLGQFAHTQPGSSLLAALDLLRAEKDAALKETTELLEYTRQELYALRREMAECQDRYDRTLAAIRQSSSWKLTAPLRAVRQLFHRGGSQ